ncbi:coiled-coil domain-containing protein 157 isoform X2 [Hydra vulgaris]|uniref:coiled-coil domain-containing protein 157 isoform X2 n=1 Tax=Hydra vulgaris TaxID=6087 RepID=UPI0032E9F0C8
MYLQVCLKCCRKLIMAHLLGSKNCIDSLCKDICQLQDVIAYFLNITGRLEFSSWKYPNKNACDIDIKEIAENYCFCDDEDANRLSHIILFEVVIDRFCLLLQCVSQFFDMSITLSLPRVRSHLETCTFTSTISVGLVTTLFKKKILQVQESYINMEKELSEHNQSLMDLHNTALPEIHKQLSSSDQQEMKSSHILWNERQSISTQTYETSFLPCFSCSNMQNCLINTGSVIISICESQGLPSLLSKYKRAYKNEMTNLDIKKWCTEQERDLNKVCKHLEDLQAKILVLDTDFLKSKTLCGQLQENFDEITQQKINLENELQRLNKLYESKTQEYLLQENLLKQNFHRIQKLENELVLHNEKEKENKVTNEHQTNLVLKVETLSGELENVRKELQSNEIHIQDLLHANQDLQKSADLKLQGYIERNTNLTEELAQAKAEIRVLLKHDQGLQEKQSKLLCRIEELEDNVKVCKMQLLDSEQHLKDVTNEKEQLKILAKNSEEKLNAYEKINYEECQKSTELSEKIKLLVCYPVIGLELETIEKEYQSILSNPKYRMPAKDDIVSDLVNQIYANETRVFILNNQIASLKNSLNKLQLANSENITFTQDGSSFESFSPKNERYTESLLKVSTNNALTPKPPCEPRTIVTRPRSSNRNEINEALVNLNTNHQKLFDGLEAPWKTNKIAAKNLHVFDQNSCVQKQQIETSCVCPDCDKSYLSLQDLEIHRNFCYGRI